WKITISVQKRLFLIGLPVTAIAIFLSEWLFGIVFGFEWIEAGKYAGILAPYSLFLLTSTPLVQVLNVFGSQSIFLMINVCRSCGLFLLLLIGKSFELEANDFVVLISAFSSLFYILITALIIFYVRREARKVRFNG